MDGQCRGGGVTVQRATQGASAGGSGHTASQMQRRPWLRRSGPATARLAARPRPSRLVTLARWRQMDDGAGRRAEGGRVRGRALRPHIGGSRAASATTSGAAMRERPTASWTLVGWNGTGWAPWASCASLPACVLAEPGEVPVATCQPVRHRESCEGRERIGLVVCHRGRSNWRQLVLNVERTSHAASFMRRWRGDA